MADIRTIPVSTSRTGTLAAPVQVAMPGIGYRVIAIVPCFNRSADLARVLGDLALTQTRWSGGVIRLDVIVVDNASDAPLSRVPTPPGLSIEHVRLERNSGGSGGFSAGLAHALTRLGEIGDQNAYVWLVDSDARVEPETLSALLAVLERDPGIVAAGAAIADPDTRQVFELGGHVNRRTGVLEPCVAGNVGVGFLVECDYLASCCALVRADAARVAGAFPDRFLNADDAEWFIRLAQRTRGRVVAVPWAVARHPRFDRFPTWTRYYATRNALGPLHALGLGVRVRMRRTLADALRATQHALVGRMDLARLHVSGLRDLAAGRVTGQAFDGTITFTPPMLIDQLPPNLRACAADVFDPPRRGMVRDALALIGRVLFGPRRTAARIPSRPGLRHIAAARTLLQREGEGFVITPAPGAAGVLSAALIAMRAAILGVRGALRRQEGPSATSTEYFSQYRQRSRCALTLDIVVLSYNRRDTLLATLRTLHGDAVVADMLSRESCRIVVVDNASTDGTLDAVRAEFPLVRVLAQSANTGIDAFNAGVRACDHAAVLILDDDAAPAPGAIGAALAALAENPALGAVTLHPRHPASGMSEWAFVDDRDQPSDQWPIMGCANLVRRAAWERAGGYESAYFLYRNDVDLALKLLALGWGVRFDPALIVWHDSPAGPGAPKSQRWHHGATRNWVWTARRHGRGTPMFAGVLLGWLWAHKAAGLDLPRHKATFRGLLDGLRRPAPSWNAANPNGAPWRSYMALRLIGRVR